jgi:hypothetical protein
LYWFALMVYCPVVAQPPRPVEATKTAVERNFDGFTTSILSGHI